MQVHAFCDVAVLEHRRVEDTDLRSSEQESIQRCQTKTSQGTRGPRRRTTRRSSWVRCWHPESGWGSFLLHQRLPCRESCPSQRVNRIERLLFRRSPSPRSRNQRPFSAPIQTATRKTLAVTLDRNGLDSTQMALNGGLQGPRPDGPGSRKRGGPSEIFGEPLPLGRARARASRTWSSRWPFGRISATLARKSPCRWASSVRDRKWRARPTRDDYSERTSKFKPSAAMGARRARSDTI